MTKATNEFRRCITEVKEAHARQIERLQRERDAALMAARVHADVDDPNSHHHMPGVEIPTTKKVLNVHKLEQDWKVLVWIPLFGQAISIIFNFLTSAPTVIVKQWPNVHCVDERHIVQHFVNERTGMRIKSNVHAIRTKRHNKSCYLLMNRHKWPIKQKKRKK